MPAAALAATLSPALAQNVASTSAGPIEEVVVTAEHKSTDLQKTPLAITAISADALEQSNVTHLADINGIVPSLTITKSAGFETIVTIRGIGDETPENALTTSPGIALIIDGAYVANSVALDQTLADVDHLEVLRGPARRPLWRKCDRRRRNRGHQATHLDSFGGTVRQLRQLQFFRERAEINFPVDDTLAIRASVQQFRP